MDFQLSQGANIWEDGAGWLVDGLPEKRLSACSQILGDHSTKVFNFIARCFLLNDNWNLSRDGYKASKMEGDYAESIKRVIMVNFWILINFPRLPARSKHGEKSMLGSTPTMRERLEVNQIFLRSKRVNFLSRTNESCPIIFHLQNLNSNTTFNQSNSIWWKCYYFISKM